MDTSIRKWLSKQVDLPAGVNANQTPTVVFGEGSILSNAFVVVDSIGPNLDNQQEYYLEWRIPSLPNNAFCVALVEQAETVSDLSRVVANNTQPQQITRVQVFDGYRSGRAIVSARTTILLSRSNTDVQIPATNTALAPLIATTILFGYRIVPITAVPPVFSQQRYFWVGQVTGTAVAAPLVVRPKLPHPLTTVGTNVALTDGLLPWRYDIFDPVWLQWSSVGDPPAGSAVQIIPCTPTSPFQAAGDAPPLASTGRGNFLEWSVSSHPGRINRPSFHALWANKAALTPDALVGIWLYSTDEV